MNIAYGTSNVGYYASYVVYENVPPSTSHWPIRHGRRKRLVPL